MKAVSKKLRFEILKRDKFKCVYCGRAAPDVVLHVDHVEPRKNGGTNSSLNLVAACAPCNQGKAAVPLPDGSAVEKQRAAADEAAARREQISMMAQWARELSGSKDDAETAVAVAINERLSTVGQATNDLGLKSVRGWLHRYPLDDVLEAVDEAWRAHGHDLHTFWKMVPNYARRIPQVREKPYLRDLFYASAVLRNRFGERIVARGENVVDVLDSYVACGVTTEEIIKMAKTASYKSYFWDEMGAAADRVEKAEA